MDWRVTAILFASLIAMVGTFVIYMNGWFQDPGTFWGAVFAGWIAGLFLFVFVGVVVAIVSLTKPTREPFDTRARILFRGEKGQHIDYIVSRIQSMLEHYSWNTFRKINVTEYDENEQKFLLVMETTTQARSYLEDVPSTYPCHIKVKPLTTAPPGKAHCLRFIKIDEQPQSYGEVIVDEIERKFDTTISPGQQCIVKICVEMWVKSEEEPNRSRPTRYTENYALQIENRLLTKAIAVRIAERENADAHEWKEFTLAPGASANVLRRNAIQPNVLAYDFRIKLA